MTADDVIAKLRAAIEEAGSAKSWAAANGFSDAYVSDVLKGNRRPGDRILLALGLSAETIYVERT